MARPRDAASEEPARGSVLLARARHAIEAALDGARSPSSERASKPPDAPWLDALGAVFVTLTIRGDLRGCIGTLEAHRALRDDVRENALAAAFRDPRFPPLDATELDGLEVGVSELSPPEPMDVASESDVVAQLRPGVDGVILEHGSSRGTFLPQVWSQLPTPVEFLRGLKRKAGLPASWWRDDVQLSRYRVREWKEGT